MIGGGAGGQLAQAIKAHYYTAADALAPEFLLRRLVAFLQDSQWPTVYSRALAKWEDYAFDLPARAAWKKAGRTEWAAFVMPKLADAIREHLPTMKMLFEDYLEQPATLVREVQAIGDALIEGSDAHKLPFYHIEKVEEQLATLYGGLIESQRNEKADTTAILQKVYERVRAAKASARGSDANSLEDEVGGPKPGQLRRALAELPYQKLEGQYLKDLQGNTMSTEDKLKMIGACLGSGSVLPIAVLFAAKGTRTSIYTGQGGSDFLALLHGERHLLSAYLGQSLAWDPDEGRVPKDLKTFRYDADETTKTRDFEWDKEDELNGCLLKLRGEEVGTEFHSYSTKNLYHDADMLSQIQEIYGRKYESLGYPREVPKEEGLSYRAFLGGIKRIQKFAMALAPDEQKGAHTMIDDLMQRAKQAAAMNAKRLIYGASPADRRLRAWLPADETVVIELNETLEAMSDTATYRRRMGTIFGKKAKAAALPGYALAGSTGTEPKTNKPKEKNKKPSAPTSTKKGNAKLAQKAPKAGGVGSAVEAKRIFMYDDGTFSIGALHVDWPGVCKHFGWDREKLCGPCVMAVNADTCDTHCPADHPAGCAQHRAKLKGKPFAMTKERQEELNKLGLTVVREQLKEERRTGAKPPGTPKTQGKMLVYPARHFA